MAVSGHGSWFESWVPPSHTFPDIFPESAEQVQYPREYTTRNPSHYYDANAGQKMGNFLPYLLALGIIPQSALQDHSPGPQLDLINEQTGPFRTIYQWGEVDFDFPSEAARAEAIATGAFIRQNNLPLGLEVWKDRIFVTMPKWKPGVPATLAWLPREPKEKSPKLKAYPNWDWQNANCSGLTSVFRMQIDTCGRLWVIDSGQIDVTIQGRQVCPPQIVIFDLETNKMIRRHVLPPDQVKQDSLHTNIIVDVRGDDCYNAHAYVTDVWRNGLVVYSFEKNRSWRVTNHLFLPDPLSAAYSLHGVEFTWNDGIFGLALSPYDETLNDRILYFHPMSSYREFYVRTSVIRNETGWADNDGEFKVLGQSRGKHGHASASAMDKNGILFFNLVSRDSVGCWDSRKAYKKENIGVVGMSNVTMIFPNDLRLDKDERQGIWVVTNRLPFYLYRQLDAKDINFRIMHAYVDEAVHGTICDPHVSRVDSYHSHTDDIDCN